MASFVVWHSTQATCFVYISQKMLMYNQKKQQSVSGSGSVEVLAYLVCAVKRCPHLKCVSNLVLSFNYGKICDHLISVKMLLHQKSMEIIIFWSILASSTRLYFAFYFLLLCNHILSTNNWFCRLIINFA